MDKKQQFTAAIKDNERFLFKIAAAYTYTTEDRMDLLQEIYYQLWKSFGTFNEKSKPGTWIYRVALNVAIYHRKTATKRITTIPIDEKVLGVEAAGDMQQEENWKIFRQYVDKLSPLEKAIVMLYMENKSHDEIAAVTGISKTNAGTRIQRIKEKIRKQVQQNL